MSESGEPSSHEGGFSSSLDLFWRSGYSSETADLLNIPTSTHSDLISFLATVQNHKLDFLPITWHPALETVGEGATSKISQSLINIQMNFAFKRTKLANLCERTPELACRTFRALASEVSVLGQPLVRLHPNMIQLLGICWEVARDEEVWPVLVFEKAEFGDLNSFMNSDRGKALSIAQRLSMCFSIGTAIATMHSCREF
jgi:Protein tyrosine and serine/threonine kinase